MSSVVLTLIGADRPGLVESVSQVVAEHGGNWLESRMSHLAGQFAGILHVAVDAEREAELVAALETLGTEGLTVTVEPNPGDEATRDFVPLELDLVGGDRPGIVREIAHVLGELGVNVEEFRTECASAPMTGDSIFQAVARLRLPPGLDVADLQQRLERVAHDLSVHVALKEPTEA